MRIILPYPPSANRYWRAFRGRTVVSAEAKAYKRDVRLKGCIPFDGPVSLTVHLYRPQKSGDLDNRLKVLCDALNGAAWHDDKQVVEIHAYRHDDKANPRVEVEVRALGVEGVLQSLTRGLTVMPEAPDMPARIPLTPQQREDMGALEAQADRIASPSGHIVTPEFQREQTEAVVPKRRRK